MAGDYASRDFNSYKSGAGALMQAAMREGGGDITLFVTNIPVGITKVFKQKTCVHSISHAPPPPLSLSLPFCRMVSGTCLVVLGRSRKPMLLSPTCQAKRQHMGETATHLHHCPHTHLKGASPI